MLNRAWIPVRQEERRRVESDFLDEAYTPFDNSDRYAFPGLIAQGETSIKDWIWPAIITSAVIAAMAMAKNKRR